MKIVAISDTHGKHAQLRMPDGDVLVHAGDFSFRGKYLETLEFLQWFTTQPYEYKIFIAGNHELSFERSPEQAKEWLKPFLSDTCIYLQDSAVTVNGVKFYGSPWQPYFCNWAFNLKTDAELREKWDLIPLDTDVLITHGPPYGYGDEVDRGHVGCKELLYAIERVKPWVHIAGHIHEGYGSRQHYDTRLINAAVLDELYQQVNQPIVYDLAQAVRQAG